MSKRKFIITTFFIFALIFSACIVEAATSSDADAKYTEIITSMKDSGKYTSIQYTFEDITGDDIHEALILAKPTSGGSSYEFLIYQYDDGALLKLLKTKLYGLSKVFAYKENKTFTLYRSGHGGVGYDYYEMKKCVYRKVAAKAKGSGSKWIYTSRSGKEISRKKFVSLTKGLAYGKKTTLKVSKWKTA